MKKIAVVCAPGIGDALILHIASAQLKKNGWDPTTFSNHLPSFGPWFQGYRFAPQLSLEQINALAKEFDAVFLQHDNSPKAKAIHALPMPVYTFYGSYQVSKHGPFRKGFDYVCDPFSPMADNVARSLESLFGFPFNKENGIQPVEGLVHRKYLKRIAIHPFSTQPEKNWPRSKFLKLADCLQKEGYEPEFLASSSERSLGKGPDLPTLEALASFIYESGFFIGNDSGPGHLASCLGIPPIILAQDEKQMRLWKPGWTQGVILFPPFWLPNQKPFQIRKKYWGFFISTRRVIDSIKDI